MCWALKFVWRALGTPCWAIESWGYKTAQTFKPSRHEDKIQEVLSNVRESVRVGIEDPSHVAEQQFVWAQKRNQIHKFCKLFFCSRTQHIKLGPLSQYSCFREVIMKLRNLYGSDFFFCPAPTLGYIHVWFSDTLLGCHWLSYHPKHPRPSKYPIPRIPWVITNECRSLSLLCGTKAGAFLEYLRPNIKHLPETN